MFACWTDPLFKKVHCLVRQETGAQTQTFWSGYLLVGWGFSRWRGWGLPSSVCTSQPKETKLFGGISGIFARKTRRCPKSLRKKKVCVHQFFQRFREGVGGRRLATDRAQMQQNYSPELCPPSPKGGKGERSRKDAWISRTGRISLRQPPLSANPFSKPLILGPYLELLGSPQSVEKKGKNPTCSFKVPFLHGWWGSCGQQTHTNVQRAMRQMLVRGHNLRRLDQA